jgi:DNA-binding response OmpR family regulator
VLVVEDDAAIRDMLTDEVTLAGVTVEQVSNGVYGTLAGVRL